MEHVAKAKAKEECRKCISLEEILWRKKSREL